MSTKMKFLCSLIAFGCSIGIVRADVILQGRGQILLNLGDPKQADMWRAELDKLNNQWRSDQLDALKEEPLIAGPDGIGATAAVRLIYLPAFQIEGWVIRLSRYADGRIDYVYKEIADTAGYQLAWRRLYEHSGTIRREDAQKIVG